jgi:hypothetical protein
MNSQLFLETYINEINNYHNKIKDKYKFIDIETLPSEIIETKEESNKPVKEIRKLNNDLRRYKKELIYKEEDENFDIFKNNLIQTNEDSIIDFFSLSVEDKKKQIYNFLNRKKYKLRDYNLDLLDDIIENKDTFKKYISFSKTHQNIEKLNFLKKNEHNEYIIDLNLIQKKKGIKKNFFGKK